MIKDLNSYKKLRADIGNFKSISFLLPKKSRNILLEVTKNLDNIEKQISLFNERFSEYGWIAYDSISIPLVEKTNFVYENEDFDTAEGILADYYMCKDKSILHRIITNSQEFMLRKEQLAKAFEAHYNERFHEAIPLFLVVIDGAVNDFTKSKGFFADGTDTTAWDCLVGCSDGLTKLKNIFNKSRNKTTTDEIYLPYRNGILHGRDLNYANKYVSSKCVALICAISDWMNYKSNEEFRKEDFRQNLEIPSIKESISKMKQNKIDQKEITNWKSREVKVGIHIPEFDTRESYKDYLYLLVIYDMFILWENKNYGKLGESLTNMFTYNCSENKRSLECRELFKDKQLIKFRFLEVEERTCIITRVLTEASWNVEDRIITEPLEFGVIYRNNNDNLAYSWKNNGEWIIMPWNTKGLYRII